MDMFTEMLVHEPNCKQQKVETYWELTPRETNRVQYCHDCKEWAYA